jgi:glycosyltransferase involved in cell wall biosynthesis
MNAVAPVLRVAYVLKRFPRLSETFILNEILELERRGVEVTIFAYLRPNDGRFHAQIARLRAKVHYFEGLDPRRWHEWLAAEWSVLGSRQEHFWGLLRESLERGDSLHVNEILWGTWVAAQCMKLRVEHMHSHFGTMSSTVAWFASRVSGIPFSFTAHAKDIYVYSFTEHRLREKMMAASRVITVTEYNRTYLLQNNPDLDPTRVRVVYNGVDLDFFRPSEAERREPGLVLSVGRLIPKKGFEDLLQACAGLRRRGVEFRAVIVGEGPEEGALLQQREILGLQDHVELAGPLPQDDVLALMHRASVLCLACKEDGDNDRDALPTVLLEALACGVPIVSTDFSGIPEIVQSGVEGFLVPPGDAESMAERLAELLHDGALRARFGQSGRRKATARFDLRRNAGETLRGEFTASATRARIQSAPHESSSKRVLVICADRGIPFGGSKGASVHLREFVEALHAGGYVPTLVVAKRDAGSEYRPTYPVHLLPHGQLPRGGGAGETHHDGAGEPQRDAEGRRARAVYDFVHDLHRAAAFDIVYERYSLFATGGRMIAQRLGLPYVLEVDAPLADEAAQHRGLQQGEIDLAREVERYLFSTADHVVTVSDELGHYVRSVSPDARVTTIPNGVNVSRFDRVGDPALWRSRLSDSPSEDIVVGFVGNVRPWHGVELLVDAMAELADLRQVKLCIVGTTEASRRMLEQRAADRGVLARVRCLDVVPPDAAPYVLKAMDVLVAPYPHLERFYFSPLKLFEYMAAGRAVVASAIGQISDLVADGRTGLLVPPGDTHALAAAIRRLCLDADLRARLGRAAHGEASRRHSWAERIDNLGTIFTAVGVRDSNGEKDAAQG